MEPSLPRSYQESPEETVVHTPETVFTEAVNMEVCDTTPQIETVELFPRWFHVTEVKCEDDCFVCREKGRGYERGSFGVVTPEGSQISKYIPTSKNVSCYTAFREIVAYSVMGTACPQITRCVEPPVIDAVGNVTLKLEQAHGSLIQFSRCCKTRQSLPGFEHMSVHFVMWSLLRAASYMNKNQLVHRDLKPGNILVFPGPRIALCDFGGCRMVSKNLEVLEGYVSDTVCTKNYAPPEEKMCKHGFVFDSFSIAATVIHYAMSCAPQYRPLNKLNRKTFSKYCKTSPGLLTLLRLMVRCDPAQRYSPQECLHLFEDIYPQLVNKYERFTLLLPGTPSRLVAPMTSCTWERFHEFKTQVWPCILESIRSCQGLASDMDGKSSVAVAYYTLNMLQNLHNQADFELCTELRCYIMMIPCFIRAAYLMVGDADDTEDYLVIVHAYLQRLRCVVLHNPHAEAVYATRHLFTCAPNWLFPENMNSIVNMQNALKL